jgi:LemA protein
MPANAGGWVLLVLLAVIVTGAAIVLYNRLVSLRQHVRGAWADIDVQLKRRADLVGNLVETVKGYATHEQRTLSEVTRLRTAASAAGEPPARAAAENALTQALRSLFAVAEAYPDLKADQSFISLQAELSQLEVDTQNARRYYNAVVRDYNTALEAFPSNLVATLGSFRPQSFFELSDDAERRPPRVSFDR